MTQTRYVLRPANLDDLDFVVSLHHATLRAYTEPIWGWDETAWDGFIAQWFVPERVQVIQVNDQDIGILVIEEQADHLFFESISVLPALQNRGIGTQVITDLLASATARTQAVKLDVLRTNTPARRLYERFGFEVYGATESHFHMMRK